MNEYKIEIIIASNKEQYLEECLAYIRYLEIPDGYELSVKNIIGAKSMAAAYNQAMSSSDAKYKIYIHQDTFLIYRKILNSVLRVFRENKDVGMLGALGGTNLSSDGIAWNAWNCGRTRAWNTAQELEINFQTDSKTLTKVQAIDGMFMATQYDIEWREDIFDGWDYYDISQSYEFIRRGYQVVVPYQEEVWCLHDCGHSKLINYEQARMVFCKEYRDFGFQYDVIDIMQTLHEKYKLVESVLELTKKLILQKDYATIELIISQVTTLQPKVTELFVLQQICGMIRMEKDSSYFLKTCNNYEQLMQRYTQIKFALRRAEYDMEQSDIGNILQEFQSGKLSWMCLENMIETCICDKEKVKSFLGKI